MACMRKRASLSVNYSWHGQSNELGMASTTNAPVSGAADRRSEADSPVGKSQILTLWFNRFAQGIYITLPYTLSVFMVRYFQGSSASEEQIGRNTGVLAAAASVGQCLSSFMWGTISDHIGRKPVLMVGNMSACLSVTALGLAPNYAAAVASRFIGGLFTSSTGVSIKSIIAESYGPVGQARVIGYTTAGYSIGTIAGPTIGGVLASPCDHLLSGSSLCNQGSWLLDRPFLLPCLVSACMSGLALLSNTLVMTETNPRFTSAKYAKPDNTDLELGQSHQGPGSCQSPEGQSSANGHASSGMPCQESGGDLTVSQGNQSRQQHCQGQLQQADAVSQWEASTMSARDGAKQQATSPAQQTGTWDVQLMVLDSAPEQTSEQLPRLHDTSTDEMTHHQFSPRDGDDAGHSGHSHQQAGFGDDAGSAEKQHLLSGARRTSSQEEWEGQSLLEDHAANAAEGGLQPESDRPWYRQRTVVVCLAGGGLITLCVNYLDELAPIFASAKATQGGLGMTASNFAWPLAFGGLTLMLFSIFFYPGLQKRWGRMNCCKAGLLTSTCAALIFPTSHFFASHAWVAQGFMFVAVGIRSIAKIMSLSSSTIIVNTVAPIKQIGSVNGAGQTLNALARSVGPLLAGVLWGECAGSNIPGKQYLPFLGSMAALCLTFLLYKRIKLPN